MTSERNEKKLNAILNKIQLPTRLYDKASDRYTSLNEWLTDSKSSSSNHAPEIFPQGSFRLGTAIYPYDKNDAYDIDLGLKLTAGLNKATITQCNLKLLVKGDLDKYVSDNGIKDDVQDKRRCLTINYQDGVSFHIDVVPGIPEDQSQISMLRQKMLTEENYAFSESLADNVSKHAIAITDNERESYDVISTDWEPSNPQGYAKWFDSRMELSDRVITESLLKNRASSVEELKPYQWNSPLQKVIMILKRHRDIMYSDVSIHDSKPISIIINTLAASAYQGEASLDEALMNILDRMENYIQTTIPMVANPVNPDEDFADKWYSKDHKDLELKLNFETWLNKAKIDFRSLLDQDNRAVFESSVRQKFNLNLLPEDLQNIGFVSSVTVATPISRSAAPSHLIKNKID